MTKQNKLHDRNQVGAWVLVFNPTSLTWEWGDDPKLTPGDHWSVQHNGRRFMMRRGDPCVWWRTGRDAGFVAVGVINGKPYETNETYDNGNLIHWIPVRDMVVYEDPPFMTREEVLAAPEFADFERLKPGNQSNPSYVTPEGWAVLKDRLGIHEEESNIAAEAAADAVDRKRVEDAAIKHVTAHLEGKTPPWHVDSVEDQNRGWDLTATHGGAVMHVEVKGVGGIAGSVFVSRNEFDKAATDPDWILAVVDHALKRPSLTWLDASEVTSKGRPETYKVPM